MVFKEILFNFCSILLIAYQKQINIIKTNLRHSNQLYLSLTITDQHWHIGTSEPWLVYLFKHLSFERAKFQGLGTNIFHMIHISRSLGKVG